VGGKHCVGRQSDKRGAKKGGIPYKPRFHEQLFGLGRVPWKSKKPALGGLVWDCVVVLGINTTLCAYDAPNYLHDMLR
jgi:hypothetical protein